MALSDGRELTRRLLAIRLRKLHVAPPALGVALDWYIGLSN